jgi:hypothetical protein
VRDDSFHPDRAGREIPTVNGLRHRAVGMNLFSRIERCAMERHLVKRAAKNDIAAAHKDSINCELRSRRTLKNPFAAVQTNDRALVLGGLQKDIGEVRKIRDCAVGQRIIDRHRSRSTERVERGAQVRIAPAHRRTGRWRLR